VKVVVTGAAGFIGSHLVDKLLGEGHDVAGVDAFVDFYPRAVKEANLRAARDHRRFRLVEGRLQDMALEGLLEGAGQVYHLAAQAGVRYSLTNPRAYADSNVIGFLNVLEGCRHSNVEHRASHRRARAIWLLRCLPPAGDES